MVFDRDLGTEKDSLERSAVKDYIIIHIETVLEIVGVDPIFKEEILMGNRKQGPFITQQICLS